MLNFFLEESKNSLIYFVFFNFKIIQNSDSSIVIPVLGTYYFVGRYFLLNILSGATLNAELRKFHTKAYLIDNDVNEFIFSSFAFFGN